MRPGTMPMLVLAAALAVLAAAPARACVTSPEAKWHAIDAALPRAELSDADRGKVKELRAKAVAALADARKAGRPFDGEKYLEAENSTHEAATIAGLEWVAGQTRGCGGTYRLKGETDAR